jgi:hypothetical protein
MTIAVKYENGVFRPLEVVAIKEGAVVEVHGPAECEPTRRRRSIQDLPFYGMWPIAPTSPTASAILKCESQAM